VFLDSPNRVVFVTATISGMSWTNPAWFAVDGRQILTIFAWRNRVRWVARWVMSLRCRYAARITVRSIIAAMKVHGGKTPE
jgi:hypothetical protein